MKSFPLTVATVILMSSPALGERATTLYALDQVTGEVPQGGIVVDRNRNIFGTGSFGGSGPCDGGAGCGTVFEVSPPVGNAKPWTLNVLYNFQDGRDGSFPQATLTLGPNGSIFGYNTGGTPGTIWQLLPPSNGGTAWTFQILYVFSNARRSNLDISYSPLIYSNGALYGIASGGGVGPCGQFGCGSVFSLVQSGNTWSKKTLYNFTGTGADGLPSSIVKFEGSKNLFVSTLLGNGSVVELSPSGQGAWNETVLTKFAGGGDGSAPGSLVTMNGALYGIAGTSFKSGIAFQLSNGGNGWTRTNIATISYHRYGPSSLSAGPNGTLIGTITGDVDFFSGSVFQLTPPQGSGNWAVSELWNFNRGPDRNPINVVAGKNGKIYGVLNGGDSGNGTVFELH